MLLLLLSHCYVLLGAQNHYDPSLACSPDSQSYATLCPSIGRTAPAYTYNCTSSLYKKGYHDFCEVGDLRWELY